MIEIKFKKAELLKKVFESIKSLVTEANLLCSKDGISIQAMDTSHVSIVILKLNADKLENYICDDPCALGLNITSVCEILKCASADDELILTCSNTDLLEFNLIRANRNSNFKLKLMDIDEETLDIPEQDYTSVVDISSVEFQHLCRDLVVFGESVIVTFGKNNVNFRVDGSSTDAEITIKSDDEIDKKDHIGIDCSEELTQTFALKYLQTFSKANVSDRIAIKASDEVPVLIKYTIDDIGSLSFHLAPKMDDTY
jgi:proliferating cell nuclear antigen